MCRHVCETAPFKRSGPRSVKEGLTDEKIMIYRGLEATEAVAVAGGSGISVRKESAVECDEMKEQRKSKERVERCFDDVWGSKPKGRLFTR